MNSIGQSSVFQPKRVTASSAVRTESAVDLTCEISGHAERFVSQEISPELQPPCIASREQAALELQNGPMKTSTIPNTSQSFSSSGELGWQVSENSSPNSGSAYAIGLNASFGMNASLGMNTGLGMGSNLGAHAAYIPRFTSSTSIPSKTWNWGWANQTK